MSRRLSQRDFMAITSLLFLGLSSFLFQPAAAGDIRMGGILPDGAMIRKQVISMRERRYLNLVPQQTDFSCGAATLATLLKYAFGQDTNEQEVMAGMLKVSDPELVRRKGFSLLDMKRYAETLGMRAGGYQVNDPEMLYKLKIPVVVLLELKGYKHFVVLQKVSQGKVYLADPALGNKVMSLEEFLPAWNGLVFAVVGDGFDQNTVLLHPAEPLSVRRIMALHSPIPEAKLLDFGFEHANIFHTTVIHQDLARTITDATSHLVR